MSTYKCEEEDNEGMYQFRAFHYTENDKIINDIFKSPSRQFILNRYLNVDKKGKNVKKQYKNFVDLMIKNEYRLNVNDRKCKVYKLENMFIYDSGLTCTHLFIMNRGKLIDLSLGRDMP